MPTVVTFNIAGAHATWESQAAGANLVFAADKEDTGTERTVDEASEYACEVWANSVDVAFDQINEVFNGTRTIQALDISGALAVGGRLDVGDTGEAANSGADDIIVGDSSGSGAIYGMTIKSDSSGTSTLYAGNENDSDTGRLFYDHTNERWVFGLNGGTSRYFMDDSEFSPFANDTYDIGRAALRWSNVYSVDGDFSGDVTVGDGSASAPSLSFGNDTNMGFYRFANDILGVSTLGSARWVWTSSGTFRPAADNAVDIGASSVRLANVYSVDGDFSGDVAVGEVLALSTNASPAENYIHTIDKATDGTSQFRFLVGNAAAEGAFQLLHNADETFNIARFNGTAWDPFIRMGGNSTAVHGSFFGAAPIARPTVTGSRGGNAALASLCTALANLGLITDSTS
jgi:hypothetical protein